MTGVYHTILKFSELGPDIYLTEQVQEHSDESTVLHAGGAAAAARAGVAQPRRHPERRFLAQLGVEGVVLAQRWWRVATAKPSDRSVQRWVDQGRPVQQQWRS